ncbi:MAG: hypothetical protein Q4C73_02060 [Eubacteriales bacterium]|nr:hypothetical protein [Eubacteriales bacterium]
MKVNARWKDRLFIRIFSEPRHLLDLYNAINDTHYTDPDVLDINTLEDVLYMHMKNDTSFIIEEILNLWEHQSTSNPNMPQYIVFYNGLPDEPERKELRLSDAFIRSGGAADLEPCLEVTAVMLNINLGKNRELMERCRQLKDYSQLVSKIRSLKKEGLAIEAAVDQAVQYCIDHDILAEFLLSHRSEAISMFLTEYDEEALREEDREEGRMNGLEQGRMEGQLCALIALLRKKLGRGLSVEDAAALLEEEPGAVRPVYETIQAHPDWTDKQVYDSLIDAHDKQ